MPAQNRLFLIVVLASALFVTGATAQEVETEIQFEDEVVKGEETTIAYFTTVVETPVETNVDTDVTLLVDGEVVETVSGQERVSEGAEIRTEFNHTFDSPGEKSVTVNGTAFVPPFGPELKDSTTATVAVLAADNEGGTAGGDSDEAGSSTANGSDDEDETGGERNAGGTDNDTEEGERDAGEATEDGSVPSDDSAERTGGGSESEEGGQGLPGFGVVTALLALAVGTAAMVGWRATRGS